MAAASSSSVAKRPMHHPALRPRPGWAAAAAPRRPRRCPGPRPAPVWAAALLSGAEMTLAAARMFRPLRHAVVRYDVGATANAPGGPLRPAGLRAAGSRPAARPVCADPDRELPDEVEELPGGRAAESVDGLVRVPHRRDGVAVAEEPGEEHQLGVGGVLELVQQHHLVALALRFRGQRESRWRPAPRGPRGRRSPVRRGRVWPRRSGPPCPRRWPGCAAWRRARPRPGWGSSWRRRRRAAPRTPPPAPAASRGPRRGPAGARRIPRRAGSRP